jgi:hypothetical protein
MATYLSRKFLIGFLTLNISPYLVSDIIISGLAGNGLFAIGQNSLRSGKLATGTLLIITVMEVVADRWVGYLHRGDCAVAEREKLEVELKIFWARRLANFEEKTVMSSDVRKRGENVV